MRGAVPPEHRDVIEPIRLSSKNRTPRLCCGVASFLVARTVSLFPKLEAQAESGAGRRDPLASKSRNFRLTDVSERLVQDII